MSHPHDHGSDGGSSTRKLIVASCICGAFMVFEIVAGLYAGSLAIVTDAAHMLSDLCSFGISLVAIYLSKLPPTEALSFGYQRVEMLGAFLSIMFIWALTLWLVVEALTRIWNPTPVKAGIMILTGIFGLCSNVVIALVLSDGHGHHHHHHHHHSVDDGHDHDHHHEHSKSHAAPTPLSRDRVRDLTKPQESEALMAHETARREVSHPLSSMSNSEASSTPSLQGNAVEGYKRAGDVIKRLSQQSGVATCAGNEIDKVASAYVEILDEGCDAASLEQPRLNVNVWAAYLHTLGDMVQNVGVILAGLVIQFKPSWTIADPICTIFFACIVVYTTLGLIQEALMLLMEGTPQGIAPYKVARALRQIQSVVDLHDLHIWSLGPGTPAMACHLVVEKDAAADSVLEEATSLVQRKFGVLHTTIQVDTMMIKAACETNAHENCQKNH